MTVLLAKRGFTSPGSRFLRDMERLGATDAWDFVNQSYLRAGRVTAPGLTFTRASVGSYLNNNNTMTVFSSGQPRIGDKGILIEGSRQNLFLNSAVGATQSITVTAVAHTLSFFGTGTVTLSGVSTAGPLVGTGEFNRVSLTFTPTAGSLTLTVSGDIKWVNLELGSFPSSWIPSDGTAVTRALDSAIIINPAISYPLVLFAEIERFVDTGLVEAFLTTSNNSTNEEAFLFTQTNDTASGRIRSGGSDQMNLSVTGAMALNTVYRLAMRVKTDDSIVARSGSLSTLDTSIILPTALNRVQFGMRGDTGLPAFNYVRKAAILPALADAQLQEVTT